MRDRDYEQMQVIPTPRFFSPIFLEDTPCLNVFQGRGTFCAAVPKLSTKLRCVCANSTVPKLTKVYPGDPPDPGKVPHVYYNTNLVGCQEKF